MGRMRHMRRNTTARIMVPTHSDPAILIERRSALLKKSWQALCQSYLPVGGNDSIWRYSREALPDDPPQGWKLHVAATILNAGKTLEAIAPFLTSRRVLFKGPNSLTELSKLNTGIFYGYSQVGKFVTIYPRTPDEAVLLARELYRRTRHFTAPSVPFDFRYRVDGCIYYRYGAFNLLEFEGTNGEPVHAIRDPDGKLLEDLRESVSVPSWVSNPFLEAAPPAT